MLNTYGDQFTQQFVELDSSVIICATSAGPRKSKEKHALKENEIHKMKEE